MIDHLAVYDCPNCGPLLEDQVEYHELSVGDQVDPAWQCRRCTCWVQPKMENGRPVLASVSHERWLWAGHVDEGEDYAEEEPMDKPTLTDRLEQLAAQANNAGAQGVWLIRGAQAAQLTYIPVGNIQQPDTLARGAAASLNLSLALDIADAGVLVLMRFPADGGEPGIEVR